MTPRNVIDAYQKVLSLLEVEDGWLQSLAEDEIDKEWPPMSFFQDNNKGHKTASRIDRINVPKEWKHNTVDWKAQSIGTLSDHWIISVKVIGRPMPLAYGGYKKVSPRLENEPSFINNTLEEFKKLERKLEKYESEIKKLTKPEDKGEVRKKLNPQSAMKTLKQNILQDAENELRKKNHENQKSLKSAKARLRIAHKKINETHKHTPEYEEAKKELFVAKDNINNETSRLNYKIARKYHESQATPTPMTEDRRKATDELKNSIKVSGQKLNKEEREKFDKPKTEEEVRKSLKKGDNHSAPGLDGLPYWVYKHTQKLYEKRRDTRGTTKNSKAYTRIELQQNALKKPI
ncbi:hypothetical protein GGX14DRAFT_408389 [Mycena pura]|uniref:Endonuclease/exonuclease/phosphatase domain-containing protein n=1 Tax=Mycena pura TaxID=153505 RepID=A0AAD6Y3H4_9AGAR|nr:hypothetical protein GGX14DRAFT_408389 [Mycena pura]